MKNINTKEIKLDKIANMIAKGFAHNDKRFDGMDKRLDRIEFILTGETRQEN